MCKQPLMENILLFIDIKLLKVSTWHLCVFLLCPLLMVFNKGLTENIFVTVANGKSRQYLYDNSIELHIFIETIGFLKVLNKKLT